MATENYYKDYAAGLASGILSVDVSKLEEISGIIEGLFDQGRTLFTAGNGGSAATASHFAVDLGKGAAMAAGKSLSVKCLNDSPALISAIGNDLSFEHVFSKQLELMAQANDVLVVFSGSGDSPNIIAALRVGNRLGLTTIGFLGRSGGMAKKYCEHAVVTSERHMGRIEDIHSFAAHSIAWSLMDRFPAGA